MIHPATSTRRTILNLRLLLGLALLATGLVATDGTGAPPSRLTSKGLVERPNIVFILTDDLDLQMGSLDYMPIVHATLANKGTTFSNYFVPVSLCCPSRATILRGQYPHNHKIFGNSPPDGGFQLFQRYELDRDTIATALETAGYRTALMGKYLNGYPKLEKPTYIPPGWSEWYVPSNDDAYGQFYYQLNENGKLVDYGGDDSDYLTDVMAGKAAGFIRRAAKAGDPFFLYLGVYSPHKPSTPAPRHEALFADEVIPRSPSYNEATATFRTKPEQYTDIPTLAKNEIDAMDELFRQRIRSLQAVDELVARVINALRVSGQLGKTYIVFSSDNGFHMGQHRFRPGKYTSYEEDIHVPLIVRGPGIPVGLERDDMVSSVDLAPTFAEMAGASLRVRQDGRSLVPLLSEDPAPDDWRQSVLIEQQPYPPPSNQAPTPTALRTPVMGHEGVLEPLDDGDKKAAGPFPPVTFRGIRTKTYKYVEYANGEREYYDLTADPYEIHNLGGQLGRTFRSRLSAIVDKLHDCQGAVCRNAEATALPRAAKGDFNGGPARR